MYYIENKYGNDGYATWIKLLSQLATSENHYLNLSDKVQFMFLSAKCKVTDIVLESIINDLVLLGEFDCELWNENKIIYSEKFILSIKDAYEKRTNDIICKNSLLDLLLSLGVRKPSLGERKPSKSTLEVPVNPHTILNDTKEDKSKVYYRKFAHLSLLNSEYEKLLETYSKNKIDEILDRIENYKKNKDYVSLFLTCKNWLKKDSETNKPQKQSDLPPIKKYYTPQHIMMLQEKKVKDAWEIKTLQDYEDSLQGNDREVYFRDKSK